MPSRIPLFPVVAAALGLLIPATTAKIPAHARIELVANRTEFFLGENVLLNYPEQAREIFSRKEYLDPRRANIGWLVQNDFSLAPDAVSQTEKASHQTQIIHSILSSAGSNHVNDFFPTPGGANRLPNFQQRHDYILEAINLGSYHERQKEIFLKSLAREFKGKTGIN